MTAATAAERMQAYRQRLKDRGGKVFRVTLSPKEVGMIEIIGRHNYPGFEVDEVIRAILSANCARLSESVEQQIRLRDEFGADDETIQLYADVEQDRAKPVTAEKFMELLKTSNEFEKQIEG